MTLSEANLFGLGYSIVGGIATLVLYWWAYRSTRVKPVLYNLILLVLGDAWGFLSPQLALRTTLIRPGHAPVGNIYLMLSSELLGIVSTAAFIWMMIALVQWGRSRSLQPGSAVTPSSVD